MSIGIMGAGVLGSNIARLFAKSGIPATIANSSGPESLAGLIRELGPAITAGTVQEAASADIVLVALRWTDLERAMGGLPAWNGRVVIDATNAVAIYGIKLIDLGGKHSSEAFRQFVPGARVVKAFNHLDAKVLPKPELSGGQRSSFIPGTMPMRKVRSARSSNRQAISPLTSVCLTSAVR
jgi:predicted dinucleotide-binding enzyme